MESKRIIYGLFEPDAISLRYVGQTINLKQRLRVHEWSPGPVGRWIRSLWDRGDDYIVTILIHLEATATGESLLNMVSLAAESKIVAWHRKHYTIPLLNLSTVKVKVFEKTDQWRGRCKVSNDDRANPPKRNRRKRRSP